MFEKDWYRKIRIEISGGDSEGCWSEQKGDRDDLRENIENWGLQLQKQQERTQLAEKLDKNKEETILKALV